MPQTKPYCTLSRTTPPFAHRKAGKNLDTAGNVRRARNSRRRACVCSSWALEEWKYASVIALGRPCRHRCRRRRLLPSSCRTLTDSPRARGPSRRKLAGSFHRFSGCSAPINQPVALSVFIGSGRSQSKHWNVRCPSPREAALGLAVPLSNISISKCSSSGRGIVVSLARADPLSADAR
jgi:hypothetical protein